MPITGNKQANTLALCNRKATGGQPVAFVLMEKLGRTQGFL